MISDKLKHILIDIAVVVLIPASVFFLYDYFRGGTEPDMVSEKPGGGFSEEGAHLAVLLRELKALHIDTSLFASPAYISLQDFTLPVPPELKGRPVPFIPVSTPKPVNIFESKQPLVKSTTKAKAALSKLSSSKP